MTTDVTPTTSPTTQPIDNAVHQLEVIVDHVTNLDWWIAQGERAILVLLVVAVAALVLHVALRVLNKFGTTRRLPDAVLVPVRRFLRWLVVTISILLLLTWFGVDMYAVWASLSAVLALIAVGFVAVWSVLTNISCSVMLLIFKPFRIGDVIELVDVPGAPNLSGRVKDVTAIYVVLREEGPNGATINIPNSLLFQKAIRRIETTRSIPLEDHVDRHGLTGKEARRPSSIDVKPKELPAV